MRRLERQAHFERLRQLYSDLSERLRSPPGNPCGTCRQCCTTAGASRHHVTALELEFLTDALGEESVSAFVDYLGRDGEQHVCPYFDEESWGCGIYQIRPYSCRIFGHHRSQTTRLPELCVFEGQERIFGPGRYLNEVPLASELKELCRSYWPYQGQDWSGQSGAPTPGLRPTQAEPEEGDALDRALGKMARGDLDGALREFEESRLDSTPYVLYCLSLVFESLRRYEDAILALSTALEEAPSCSRLWFRLGCNQCALGQTQQSVEAFTKTIELEPSHALAHALLGYHHLARHQLESAREHLERSWALEPDPRVERQLQRLQDLEWPRTS